jgi:anti-sigma factor RsiW
MSEQPYQPDDPAFLASRALDGDLSEPERQRLEEALATSKELRAEVEQLRKVDQLVKRWGGADVELDWATYGKLVRARAESDADEGDLGRVDQLIERWGRERVEFDEAAFTGAVMARVRSEERRPPRRSLIFRIGAPLAAAAAVAIAAGAWFWASGPHGVDRPGEVGHQRLVVVFDHTLVGPITDETKSSSISLLALGAAPMTIEGQESPPS